MTDGKFTPKQEAAMEAMEAQERRASPPSKPARDVASPAAPARPAAAARPASRMKAPESPVGALIGSVVATLLGGVLIGVGGARSNLDLLIPVGILVAAISGVIATAAVIAIGVRWGMNLHAQDQR